MKWKNEQWKTPYTALMEVSQPNPQSMDIANYQLTSTGTQRGLFYLCHNEVKELLRRDLCFN